MKPPEATPEKRVKETEVNVQRDVWKFIAATLKPVLKSSGGDMVIIYNTPEGQIPMFWTRSWGKNRGGRGWYARQRLPPNTKRLTIMTPHPERAGVDCMAPAKLINWLKTWPEVREELKQTYGTKAKVVVLPDVTVQYFPGVPAGKPIGVKH